nr:transposase [Saccharothrix variisporea]
MAGVRPVIEGFAAAVFGGFGRRDQRGKGELYLRGLLLDGRRKSMQPMAERLGVDHQQLQQFANASGSTNPAAHTADRRRTSTWSQVEVVTNTGRPPTKTTYPDKPVTAKTLITEAGRSAGRFVVWRHGSRKSAGNPNATMRSRFLALRVRPANRNIPRAADGSLPECRLPAEWPTGQPEPTDYWLSTLPTDIRLRNMVRIAKIRRRIEHDYRDLKDGLGLDHFEGRSWLG